MRGSTIADAAVIGEVDGGRELLGCVLNAGRVGAAAESLCSAEPSALRPSRRMLAVSMTLAASFAGGALWLAGYLDHLNEAVGPVLVALVAFGAAGALVLAPLRLPGQR